MKTENILIFNREVKKSQKNFIPRMDLEDIPIDRILPKKFHRNNLRIPDIPEPVIVRHYINLSTKNYGVDTGIYPLGSCTMKYNPKINEIVARLPGFSNIHPLQLKNQGALELIFGIAKYLGLITGMEGFTMQPAAGAHGELTGLFIRKPELNF